VLKVSLYMMMLVTERRAEGDTHLERIGKLHGRSELGVRPELYDLWLDCLIRAVKEFDPLFNREIEAA
jgi:hemoglobin-like flavoprotein